MGQELTVMQEIAANGQHPSGFCCQPLEKVYEFHSLYRSVCQNFTISRSQFEQIFGSTASFGLWEREHNDKIDALQLFAGLAIFSETNFKHKLKFLFDMFDFNEVRSISGVDLEYLIVCVCNATLKIYGRNVKVNNTEVIELARRMLWNDKRRVTITRLLKCCISCPEVRRFFEIISRDFPEEPETKNSQELERTQYEQQPADPSLQSIYSEQLSWFNRLNKKLAFPDKPMSRNSDCAPRWIFGFNAMPLGAPFVHIGSNIVYAVSSFVVVHLLLDKEQRIYNQHNGRVSSLAHNNNIVASAEQGSFSKIHLWNMHSLQTLNIIVTSHLSGVNLMAFVKSGSQLVTIGSGHHNSLLVYNVSNMKLACTSQLPKGKLVCTSTIKPFVRNHAGHDHIIQHSLVICHSDSIMVLKVGDTLAVTTYQAESRQANILCCTGLLVNRTNPSDRVFSLPQNTETIVLTGHANGEVCSTSKDNAFQVMCSVKFAVQFICCFDNSIAIASGSSIYLYDLELFISEVSPFCEFDLARQQGLSLISPLIRFFSLPESPADDLLILTNSTQLVAVADISTFFDGRESFYEKFSCRKINSIFAFTGTSNGLCILEKRDSVQQIAFCCVSNKSMIGINLNTHEIVDTYNFSESVSAIDCSTCANGAVAFVFGCHSGKLFIRLDWEETPKCYDCSSEIVWVRLAYDCSYLLVGTRDCQLLVFSNMNGNFVGQAPRKIHFEGECPRSLEFSDDNKSFVVCMDSHNLYQFYLPDLKHKNVFNDNEPLFISQWRADFCVAENGEERFTLPGIIGGDQQLFFIADASGTIRCYQNVSEMEADSHTLLRGHCAPASKLAITTTQNLLLSLSTEDHIMVEWSLEGIEFQVQKENPKLKEARHNCSIRSRNNKREPQSLMLCRGIKNKKLQSYFAGGNDPKPSRGKANPNASLKPFQLYGFEVGCGSESIIRDKQSPKEIYFYNSRFVVRLNIETLQQHLVERELGHISCIALSQDNLLAIGEGNANPEIYLMPDRVISTTHGSCILHMAFYGDLLYSFGETGSTFTINVHNHHTGTLVDSRHLNQRISRFLLISERQFVSTQKIRLWKNLHPMECLGEACCADILQMGERRDVLFGSNTGSLLIYTNKKLITVKEKAHAKEILAVSCNRSGGLFSVTTAGADQLIKIWDSEFREKASLNLRSEEILPYLSEEGGPILPEEHFLAYSISACENSIVVGLSTGQLFNIEVQAGCTQLVKSQAICSSFIISEVLTQHNLSESETYEFKAKQLLAGFPFRSKMCFTVHPHAPLIVSSTLEHNLTVLNYATKEVLTTYYMEDYCVTCLKFSPNAKYLAVGCRSGALKLYEVKLKASKDDQVNGLTLSLSQSFETMKSPVLAVSFSPCSTFFAVSYFPEAGSCQSIDEVEQSPRSKVVLFLNRDSALKTEGNYSSYGEFEECIYEPFRSDQTGRYCCATMMHFVGKPQLMRLIVYFQAVSADGTKFHRDSKAEYRVYNLKSRRFLVEDEEAQVDWLLCPIPNDLWLTSIANRQTSQFSEALTITQMIHYKGKVICGGVSGELYVFDNSSLQLKDAQPEDMFIAKQYRGLSSEIIQMELSHDGKYLFVSSEDSCLLQLRLTIETEDSQLLLDQNVDIADWEVHNKEQFFNYMNNAIPARQLLSSMLEDIEDKPTCPLELDPVVVIGRRAFDRRKNLFYDGISRLVYNVGPNIVLEEIGSVQNTSRQNLIKGDPAENSSSPQISCFTVDDSYELLAVATEEEEAKIIVWNLHTALCLSRTTVGCSIVQGVNFSRNNRLISAYGVTRSYYPVVVVLDWRKNAVLCQSSLIHWPVWLIKDMTFHANNEFLMCGVQHLSVWSCNSGKLTFDSFELDKVENTTFTVVVAHKKKIFTACEGGYIYTWDCSSRELLGRVVAHQAAVRGLLVTQNKLISVGMDGRKCTFDIAENGLSKKHEIMLNRADSEEPEPETKVFSARNDIQSITTDGACFYIGTRSGDVYKLGKAETPTQLICCSDQDKPVSLAFDDNSATLFVLSSSGFLQMWDLRTLKCRWHHFQKRFLKMLWFRSGLLLVMERSIIVVELRHGEPSQLQEFSLCFQAVISDAKLSPNQQLLAVATVDSDKNELFIYDVEAGGFKLVRSHPLSSEVEFLDFSVDSRYLLFKDRSEDLGIVECKELKRINTIFIEYDIEWSSDGRILNEKAMNIHACYHRENTITKILQLQDKYVLVGDQMGSLRLFDYPCESKRVGELHLRCYSQHMNMVSCLEGSNDGKWVASASQLDRSVVLWRVR